jgi:hypothetical protein
VPEQTGTLRKPFLAIPFSLAAKVAGSVFKSPWKTVEIFWENPY